MRKGGGSVSCRDLVGEVARAGAENVEESYDAERGICVVRFRTRRSREESERRGAPPVESIIIYDEKKERGDFVLYGLLDGEAEFKGEKPIQKVMVKMNRELRKPEVDIAGSTNRVGLIMRLLSYVSRR